MSIVERIKQIGMERGLSLTQIEQGSGIATRTIYKWEKSSPSIDKVIAVANFLSVPLYWLVTGKQENVPINDFLTNYMRLSTADRLRIDHFIDVCLIDSKPLVTYEYHINNNSLPRVADPSVAYYTSSKNGNIAVLGYVAAGAPIEGISVPLGYIDSKLSADYALIAKGHSMEPIIYDGEHIFVKNTSTLEYGEIGIFYINGEVTCKKYHPTDECIYLESLNPDFQPFKYDFKNECDFKIQGRVLLTSEQKARIK